MWEGDPEAVSRHRRLQAIGQSTKQNIAMQVVADCPVDVKERCGFKIEALEIRVGFAKLFVGVLALQLGATTRREYFQRRNVLFGRFQRLPVQHR